MPVVMEAVVHAHLVFLKVGICTLSNFGLHAAFPAVVDT